LVSGADSFADYTPAVVGVPDYTWSIASTASEFGYTAEGSDIVQLFKDDGVSCNNLGGSDTSSACWYNFSTSDENIAQSYLSNHASGTETIVSFRAESGSSHFQALGSYQASIIFTAVSN